MVSVLSVKRDEYVAGLDEEADLIECVVADGPGREVGICRAGVDNQAVERLRVFGHGIQGEDILGHGGCMEDVDLGSHVFGDPSIIPLSDGGAQRGLRFGVLLPSGQVRPANAERGQGGGGHDQLAVEDGI